MRIPVIPDYHIEVDHHYYSVPYQLVHEKVEVERSHATDDMEFYQLLTYTGDVDLMKKLWQLEEYYNFHRPHGGLHGRTPYEVLREKLKSGISLSTEV